MFTPPPRRPLGVLLHVVQVGRHDEVLGVVQAPLVGVFLPAGVVALMRDVALASARLELPEVQPGMIVLQRTKTTLNIKHQLCPLVFQVNILLQGAES